MSLALQAYYSLSAPYLGCYQQLGSQTARCQQHFYKICR